MGILDISKMQCIEVFFDTFAVIFHISSIYRDGTGLSIDPSGSHYSLDPVILVAIYGQVHVG